jgi:type I restriction enzyme R subunit
VIYKAAKEVTDILGRELNLSGFWDNVPARSRLKGELQKAILSPENVKPPDVMQKRHEIISRIMEVAQKNHDVFLYAA